LPRPDHIRARKNIQMPSQIASPDHPALDDLCVALADNARLLDDRTDWPATALQLCADYGVFRWFLPHTWGGLAWSDADLVRGYLRLSAASLVTTFILTQRSGACQRIVTSENHAAQARWLPALADGSAFATVGISHLTTSRRHLAQPVLTARETEAGFALDGYSPWVTGAPAADVVVLGATLADGRQVLLAVDAHLPGFSTPEPPRLVGLSASSTGEVRLSGVVVPHNCVLAGPTENVMQAGKGAGTGGLQTSTLAVGLATAAIDFLQVESRQRPDLASPAAELRREQQTLAANLLAVADGQAVCSNEELRTRANSLVLRATQSALGAAKGAGYVVGHPAGRWCREALFFLVWSCPQAVLSANLCELAGIEG
jgi:alkylation response protein AidB-like acyl-CoA dehydrogenase